MQLRISPGGRTSNSRRRRPELPPSSVTVTMAVISTAGAAESAGRVYRLRPFSTDDRPVPPPMATTRSGERSSMHAMAVLLIGVEQGIEGRPIRQGGEIGILTGDAAVARLQFDSAPQVFVGARQVAGKSLG